MKTEYSKDMIAFAEDVADMMAKRRKVERIKKASPFHCKYNDDDYAAACYELRIAECEVRNWLRDIFGEE